MPDNILIYGATGCSAKLIIALARERRANLILAGRREARVRRIAEANGMDSRIFGLEDRSKPDAALIDVDVVHHCAGPFSQTSEPMVDACIRTGTHYLDITGEIDVFERCAMRSDEAPRGGVMLLPGVGFDVVPSDCLAAYTASKILAPHRVTLAIMGPTKMSRGTAKTAIESIRQGVRVRRGGRIVPLRVPIRREIEFGNQRVACVSIAWGDVATAYHSTGANDVEVLFQSMPEIEQAVGLNSWLRFLLGTGLAQRILKRQVDKQPDGPDPTERQQGSSAVFAEVEGAGGEMARALLRAPEAYSLTADGALTIALRVAAGEAVPGFQTPSLAFGADFVLELDSVTREDLN